MQKKAALFLAPILLFTVQLLAQYNRLDVAVSATDLITKTSSGNNVTQSASNDLSGLLTVRFRFSARNALAFNYGRAGNSQFYFVNPDTYRIQARITEYSGAYTFTPIETRNFEPFLMAGIGALKFNPYAEYIDTFSQTLYASQTTQLAFIYGGGLDYKVFSVLPIVSKLPFSSRFALRLQYRGLIYKEPFFKEQQLFSGVHGHIAEPSAGIVFKF